MDMLRKQLQNLRNLYQGAIQDFAVFHMVFLLILGPVIVHTLICLLLFTQHYILLFFYLLWYIYDCKIGDRGGRVSKWYCRLPIWNHLRDYFKVRIVKTAELPATKNYLVCYHPHGLCPMGMFCFSTDVTNANQEFPGLIFRPLMIDILLRQPIYREFMVPFGFCTASKKGIDWLLTKEGTGNALVLVVGGAAESLYFQPGTATLVLKQRNGFIKLALQHGVPLVPTFGFGETDIFNQIPNPEGSRLRRFQNKFLKIFKFATPLFYGEKFWLLPFKKPITVVVGEPIHLQRIPEPTEEDIQNTHKIYVESLIQLFEKHKAKYGPHLNLKIV